MLILDFLDSGSPIELPFGFFFNSSPLLHPKLSNGSDLLNLMPNQFLEMSFFFLEANVSVSSYGTLYFKFHLCL